MPRTVRGGATRIGLDDFPGGALSPWIPGQSRSTMIVLCAGMHRACSTWQYGVAGTILERHRAGRRLGFVDGERFATTEGPVDESAGWCILETLEPHPGF